MAKSSKILKIGIPKGSLQESTIELFKRAGFNISIASRSYIPYIDDPAMEGMMFRAQEMARYVERGVVDVGLTGIDWILETGAKVKIVADLVYSKSSRRKVRWVLAVPENSKIRRPEDLHGKLVATELVNVTKKYFAARKIKPVIEFSWGATEVKVATGIADAVVEATETGSTFRAHNLREVETILESNTKLIANREAWGDPWKRRRIEDLFLLLNGVLEAEKKVGLKMNIPRKNLGEASKLPSMKKPTVSYLSDPDWAAIEIIVDQKQVRELIPLLKEAGACDIIEYKLNKVIA